MFERRPIPFRGIFPLGQLTLCWFMTALVYGLPFGWNSYRHTMQIIHMLSLPGDLLQFPITLFRPNKIDWHPPFIDPFLWSALSWPVLALVFWWIAGRAVEALLALRNRRPHPRITLVEAIVGGVLMLGGVLVVSGLAFSKAAQIYTNANVGFSIAASGLWAVLGGLSVVARFRQRRLGKSIAATTPG